jgi:hypothetical protein
MKKKKEKMSNQLTQQVANPQCGTTLSSNNVPISQQQLSQQQAQAGGVLTVSTPSYGGLWGTSAGTGGLGWSQSQSTVVYKHPPTKNSELIAALILGKMTEHGIPQGEYETIKKTIYSTMMEMYVDGSYSVGYVDFALAECGRILPTWKFKTDMKEILDDPTN